MPELDFTGVPDQEEWKPAPTGDYILELVDVEEGGTIKTGPNAGQPLDKLQFEIVDCDLEAGKYNGRRIYNNATYTEDGLRRLKTMLRAFGVDVDSGPLKFDWDELLSKKVRANLRSVPKRPKDNAPGEFWSAKNEINRFLVPKDEEK